MLHKDSGKVLIAKKVFFYKTRGQRGSAMNQRIPPVAPSWAKFVKWWMVEVARTLSPKKSSKIVQNFSLDNFRLIEKISTFDNFYYGPLVFAYKRGSRVHNKIIFYIILKIILWRVSFHIFLLFVHCASSSPSPTYGFQPASKQHHFLVNRCYSCGSSSVLIPRPILPNFNAHTPQYSQLCQSPIVWLNPFYCPTFSAMQDCGLIVVL